MSEELEAVRQEIETGELSPQTLVRLYAAAAEAERARDVPALAEARALAERLAEQLDAPLRPEAEHLIELCNELLKRVETGQPPPATGATICPSCGHELDGSPVRCRNCGELLV